MSIELPVIRLARPGDAAGCLDIYRPVVLETASSFEIAPPDPAQFGRYVEETLRTYPWLVCDDAGTMAGYAYARAHRARPAYGWCTEVSVYVAAGRRRRGIARGLYRRLFACLRLQGFLNAYAGIALPNEASVALHERCGFEPVGVYRRVGYKHGAWHDVGWWALRLDEGGMPPAQPRPLRDCVAEADALLQSFTDSAG